MKKQVRTDLACEAIDCSKNIEGTNYKSENLGICTVEIFDILTDEASKALGKKAGRFITVKTDKIQNLGKDEADSLSVILSSYIKEMAKIKTRLKSQNEKLSVLVVGLGNEEIISDAIGAKSIPKIQVTRHIKGLSPHLFNSLYRCEVSAFAPNVLCKTGIESAEIIKAIVEKITPDLIIVIDSLAAKSSERLGTTIQITDTGISPGAGIGNRQSEISYDSFKIPVIAIGIPTVIDSYTMVMDTLESFSDSENMKAKVSTFLEKQDSFFVTPKEIDLLTEKSCDLLSSALNEVFFESDI